MLCLRSCRLSWDLEVERVYPKLSSIGFMMRIAGADQVVWVMTGVKALTDVCWGMLEVEAAVDIVSGRLETWLWIRKSWRGRELWPSFDNKPGYIPPSPKSNFSSNPISIRDDCCHRCHGHVK